MALQENVLTMLFLNESAAEEVKLTFSKAKVIHAFSFVAGSDDFNFVIVTNLSIDLYRADINAQRARIVKNIPLDLTLPQGVEPHILLDPITSSVLAVDPKSGTC